MDLPKKESSALDEMEGHLYDPKVKSEVLKDRNFEESPKSEIPTSWGEENPIIKNNIGQKKVSFGGKFLLLSFVVLILSILFTGWRVLSSRNIVSANNIDMTLDLVSSIEGGEETPLVVSIHNRNSSPLLETTVVVSYKRGVGSQDEQEKIEERRVIGIVNKDEYKRQDFKILLYGREAESRDINLKLEYKVTGSNAVFSKTEFKTVVLKTSPMSIHIDGPSVLSGGQIGVYTFSIKNNTGTTSLANSFLLNLPNNFKVISTYPKSEASNSLWNVDPINPGEKKEIVVSGSVSGSSGEINTIKASVGAKGGSVNSIGVLYSTETFDIALRSSPLTINTVIDTGHGGEVLKYGDKVGVTINYKNSGDKVLRDLSVNLKIDGNAAILKDVNPTDGYYNSITKTITWNKANINQLDSIPPGGVGSFVVYIPIISSGSNSPSLNLNTTALATVTEKDDVTVLSSKNLTIQGSAILSAKTNYKNSPFQNTGPIPPEPNVATTYSGRFSLSSQNNLINARVSFVLPIYVTWKNMTTDDRNISYNTKNRTVTWSIGNLSGGKTINSDMVFSVVPSQSHVNQTPAITSGIVLDADEEVSKAHIKTTISPLTTYIGGEDWSVDPSIVKNK